jgi:D-arabinose 1-dehydrogenase-like Zn-dependent alcohol dehydrogenase
MPWLLSLATGIGIPPRFAKFAVIGAGIVLLLLIVFAAVKIHDHRVVAQHEQQLQQRAKPATDQAAAERSRDTITQAKNEEEAHNAVHSVPDAAPAGPSHALACKRLRDHGRHPASCG